ncbi:MAG: hypothetical protein AAB676_05875 [Verrucomicrobiota bacterium]
MKVTDTLGIVCVPPSIVRFAVKSWGQLAEPHQTDVNNLRLLRRN